MKYQYVAARVWLLAWALSACASGPLPRSAAGDRATADAGTEGEGMTAQRMKDDLAKRQREEDQLRSRDDFIQRNQRP